MPRSNDASAHVVVILGGEEKEEDRVQSAECRVQSAECRVQSLACSPWEGAGVGAGSLLLWRREAAVEIEGGVVC